MGKQKINFSMTDDEVSELSVDEQVVLLTRRTQAQNPELSYAKAQELTLSANPKLAQAYVDSNGYLNADREVIRPDYSEASNA